MPDLADLKLADDPIEAVDMEAMPEERGRTPMPQPNKRYTFQIPDSLDYDTVDTKKGQRIAVNFRRGQNPLNTYPDNLPVDTRINNMDRLVGPEGKKISVNDWAYLLRALGHTEPLKKNADYAVAMEQYKGHYFEAEMDWESYCNDQKPKFVQGKGKVEGSSGCGQRWATRTRTYTDSLGRKVTVLQIPREADATFKERFDCTCGAGLFVNAVLRGFKKVEPAADGDVPF